MENPFEGMRIDQIVIITREGVGVLNAGPKHPIKRFENKSQEFPDHIYSCYWGYDENNKVIKVIENCPVDISYVPEGYDHD
jgi:hypothetical protein